MTTYPIFNENGEIQNWDKLEDFKKLELLDDAIQFLDNKNLFGAFWIIESSIESDQIKGLVIESIYDDLVQIMRFPSSMSKETKKKIVDFYLSEGGFFRFDNWKGTDIETWITETVGYYSMMSHG